MNDARHVLYRTGDKDAPTSIQDMNGDVVLGLCRNCGRGESELDLDDGACPNPKRSTTWAS